VRPSDRSAVGVHRILSVLLSAVYERAVERHDAHDAAAESRLTDEQLEPVVPRNGWQAQACAG
jgi:hypothetical protein